MTEALPPYDADAERALAGAVIVNPAVITELSITKHDFYLAQLGEVYDAVRCMVNEGKAVDLITLPAYLAAKKIDVPFSLLIQLMADMPSSMHAHEYAEIVRNMAKRRQAIRLASKIATEAQRSGDVDQTIIDELKRIAAGDEPPPAWRIRTLEDVYQERKSTRYLVDGIIPTPSLNVWFGAPGSMKTLLLMDLAVCVVSGAQWLPGSYTPISTEAAPVLWIDTDNGNDVMHERFAAMAKARNLPKDAPLFYVSMPDPWFFAANISSQFDLKMHIERTGAKLVVIDNLGNITGNIEENSANMVQVMSPLRRIAEEMDVAIIVIHHQRKSGAATNRAGDSLRGHSTIEASLDFAVLVTTDETSKITTIKCTKARRFSFDDLRAQLNYDHVPGTYDFDTAWFTAPTIKRGDNPIRDAIYETLSVNGKMTQERLIETVYDYLDHKYGKAKIRAWLKEMTSLTQELVVEKGPNNAILVSAR